MAKIIEPCDSERGHFWRPVNERVSQCSRCGECATAEDFALTAAPAATPTCAHEWVSGDNQYVSNTLICQRCYEIKPAATPTDGGEGK